MRAGAKLTNEQIEEARTLQHTGWSLRRIGERLGCSYEVIRRTLDAYYAGQRSIQAREQREIKRFTQNRTSKDALKRENATSSLHREDALARLAEIPPDTRSLTGVYCGDPLPGRSALDKRSSS